MPGQPKVADANDTLQMPPERCFRIADLPGESQMQIAESEGGFRMNKISGLISQVEEAVCSEENRKKLNNDSSTKLIVAIGRPVFAAALGFSLLDYYNDPKASLESQLRWKLFCHQEIKDDSPIDLLAGIDYSNALEPSFFGSEPIITETSDPTYLKPIIDEPEDLDRLALPDFHRSGLMPRIHENFQALNELAGDRLKIFMTGWARGPWSIGMILRGFSNILIDSIENPEFLHKLMQFTVDARIHFEEQRCRFLDIDPKDMSYVWKYVTYRSNTNSDLFEDEVDGNIFSRAAYLEFILPYVRKLEAFYGGISYYHSCGNLTPFLPEIAAIENLKTIHVSPWTDFKAAVEAMPRSVVLQRSLHPVLDVAEADDDAMREKLKSIIHDANGRKLEIWADGLYSGSWRTIGKAKRLVEIFRELQA